MSELTAAAGGNLADISPDCISCLMPCSTEPEDKKQACGLACSGGQSKEETIAKNEKKGTKGRDKPVADIDYYNDGDGRGANFGKHAKNDEIEESLSGSNANADGGVCEPSDLMQAEQGQLGLVPMECIACLLPCGRYSDDKKKQCGMSCTSDGGARQHGHGLSGQPPWVRKASKGDELGDGFVGGPYWGNEYTVSKSERKEAAKLVDDKLSYIAGNSPRKIGQMSNAIKSFNAKAGKGRSGTASLGPCEVEDLKAAESGQTDKLPAACLTCLAPCAAKRGNAKKECGMQCNTGPSLKAKAQEEKPAPAWINNPWSKQQQKDSAKLGIANHRDAIDFYLGGDPAKADVIGKAIQKYASKR